MTGKLDIAIASLRIFCAMLLLFAGLAHQAVAARGMPSQGMAVYVLPDGTVPGLCLPGEDGKPLKTARHGCEACRIASGILLPEAPLAGYVVKREEIAVASAPASSALSKLPLEPGAPPRGPPAFFA